MDAVGSLGSPRADAAVHDDALGLLAAGTNATLTYGPDGERRGEGMRVFVWGFAPKPRMLVFGAIDFAAAVARVGSFLGYHVTVCDARPVFATAPASPRPTRSSSTGRTATSRRSSRPGRIDPRTVLAVLTHDPKFDVPLLEVALRLADDVRPGFIGAMGSRRTHEERLERLREAGLTDAELDLLSSPIGLDLGARTPEETAVSIAAEIVARRWGGSGERLAATRGPHPPRRLTPAGARRAANWPPGGPRLGSLGCFFLPRCPVSLTPDRLLCSSPCVLLLTGVALGGVASARQARVDERSLAAAAGACRSLQRGDAQPEEGDAGPGSAARHRSGAWTAAPR